MPEAAGKTTSTFMEQQHEYLALRADWSRLTRLNQQLRYFSKNHRDSRAQVDSRIAENEKDIEAVQQKSDKALAELGRSYFVENSPAGALSLHRVTLANPVTGKSVHTAHTGSGQIELSVDGARLESMEELNRFARKFGWVVHEQPFTIEV